MSLAVQITVLLLVDIRVTNALIEHQDIAAVAEVGIEIGNVTEIETESAVVVIATAAQVPIVTKVHRATRAADEVVVVVELDIINLIGHCIKLYYCGCPHQFICRIVAWILHVLQFVERP
jgi:hypothetical protein